MEKQRKKKYELEDMPRLSWPWMGLLLLFSSCVGKKAITKKEIYWNIQTMDASGGNVGRFVESRLNAQGHPYLVYLKGVNLNTSFFDGQAWQMEESPLGLDLRDQKMDLELDDKGNPHVLYLSPNGLQYVYRVGGEGWAVGFISKGVGSGLIWDLDLKNNREPSFVFENKAGKLVVFARYRNFWREEEILTDMKSIEDDSLCVSLRAVPAGSSVALAQNRHDGSAELLASIQGKSQRIFHWVDRKINHCQLYWNNAGVLHGVFLAGPLGSEATGLSNLISGSFIGGAWSEQLLSRDIHFVGEANPLALVLDKEGRPHIVYFDWARGGLVYLYKKTDRFWPQAPVIPLERFSGGLSLAIGSASSPWIFFRDEISHELKSARRLVVP